MVEGYLFAIFIMESCRRECNEFLTYLIYEFFNQPLYFAEHEVNMEKVKIKRSLPTHWLLFVHNVLSITFTLKSVSVPNLVS